VTAAELTLPSGWDRDEVNRWLRYHSEVAHRLTSERTALASALIPVTPYILIAGVECYRRHPEMMQAIAAAAAPEALGASGRTPGRQVDTVHMWSIANIYLVGRQVLAGGGLIDWDADVARTAVVLDFWRAAARGLRADGTLQASDARGVVRPYTDHVDEIVRGCAPIDGSRRAYATRLNALLCSYLFLLYFDTRAGYQDSGPYELGDGRIMLLRSFNKFGVSDFPWSVAVAAELPVHDAIAAFVLDGVDLHVTDFGTSVTKPENYLERMVGFGLFAVESDGRLTPIDDGAGAELARLVKAAQRTLYRLIAGMTRRERIDAGAYVYFSFLRPFSDAAGVTDDLDWSVPRDSGDLYPLLELLESTPEIESTPETYYTPLP